MTFIMTLFTTLLQNKPIAPGHIIHWGKGVIKCFYWVCLTDDFLSPIVSSICKVWSMFYYRSVWRVTYNFLTFFCCFSKKKCVFIIFFFFDKVWNFHNRILTNQKPELVVRSSQWNYMLVTVRLWPHIS